jgi:PAS domain S-box-containing protein
MGTDKNKRTPAATSELRHLAEDRLRAEQGSAASYPSFSERLINELQVHQIELEMQNDELRQSRDERDKMEAMLGKYSDLYDFAPAGYFNLSRRGIIHAVNLTGVKLLGIERSLLINSPFDLFLSNETRPVFHDFLDKTFSDRNKVSCEVELVRKGLSPLFLQVEALVSGSGEDCRAVVIDITERRQAEEALNKLNKELERKVEERTAELRDKDHMILSQSRQAAIGEMICNIAHQWRQPLNILALYVQDLLSMDDSGELTREALDNSVQRSMEVIGHMSQTIDDFRTYFRPDKESIEFKVTDAIKKTLSLLDASLKNDRIDIKVITINKPTAIGFKNEFSQVMLNIMNNARDALLERKVGDPMVTITIDSENGRAVVIISDNAGGIPEEHLGKIFDPYFTTKGPQAGTGVGLFMSKAIIEKNMKGSLTARNTADGAEFRIVV